MRRRNFIKGIVGSAAVWPLAAHAQQPDRMRRIGMLMSGPGANDVAAQAEVAAFHQALKQLGWSEGNNLRIESRWPGIEVEPIRAAAKELVALNPDVILSRTTPATVALKAETTTIPIVFTVVVEPTVTGLVKSFARPGGNITGFTNLEGSIGGKWVELLKEVAPGVTRIAALYNPISAPYASVFLRSAGVAATSLAVELIASPVRNDAEINAAITVLANQFGGGLIGIADSFINSRRELIIGLASRFRLPAIYAGSYATSSGGLIAYGVDFPDLFRRAAGYIDRILKGTKPADLPVQAPTRFNLVINRKTATALGIKIPDKLIALADEVIE